MALPIEIIAAMQGAIFFKMLPKAGGALSAAASISL
jgi:hypothetical protein